MSINQGTWDLHKAGSKDAYRHQQKLKDAFKKQLHEIISQEDIITADGSGRRVRVPVKALDSYRFIYDRHSEKQVGQGDGETEVGDVVGREGEQQSSGKQAGKDAGEEYYEAEIDLDDLIEMMLEDLKLPRLEPKKQHELTSKELQYDDIRKRGSISRLDKKRSIVENIKRNAKSGEGAKVADISQDDLRFRTWTERERPVTSAVVFALMDVSGSMGADEKYISRSFFFWMVNFLRHKYENVEVRFIAHTTEAHFCSEHDFFHRGESGGTKCSSAYKLALETIEESYNPQDWNTFVFHFSDGETFGDMDECVALIDELLKVSNMVGYSEIKLNDYGELNVYGFTPMYGGTSSLLGRYKSAFEKRKNFVQAKITEKGDVWRVLKMFFSDEMET